MGRTTTNLTLKSNQQHSLMSSPIEGSDGDDVSSYRVASTKHGGSSQVQVPEPAEIIGREPSHSEMWKQTHLKKESRPFDKDLDCSSSVVEKVDLEDVDL
ncbi:hypothetical protein Hanom_Chr07g00663291 [Helianthus anomalus]